ncbi:MAG: hypothetical protein R6X02_17570 [Enhygromyxa sp.]
MAPLAALTVALSLFAAPPQSQLAYGPEARAPSESSESSELDSERAAAKRAFDRGLDAVARGHFEAAVAAFEEAYRTRPHPVTLFNLALALEKAERLPEAYGLFDAVVDVVESDAERREVRRHMRTIANEIAIVEIDARPRRRLCLDGVTIPAGKTSDYRLAIEPGRHRMVLDDHEFDVEFTAGDRRVLLLDDADALVEGRRRGPLMPAMVGVTIGGGALAVGLGIGAALVTHDQTRTGLAAGSAGSAGLAVAAGIVALLLETRRIEDPGGGPSKRGRGCPGSPELERRLDLQLGPMVERPAEFAELGGPAIPMPIPPAPPSTQPSAIAAEFPHPRSIVPPRAEARPAGPSLDQKRPTSTTPM